MTEHERPRVTDDESVPTRPPHQPGSTPVTPVRGPRRQRDRAVDLSPTTLDASSSEPRADPMGHDPLRLCIFATVALLAWLGGPFVVAVFAMLGLVGYTRARRGGLLRSRCLLGDTRIVLAYLAALLVVAGWGIYRVFSA